MEAIIEIHILENEERQKEIVELIKTMMRDTYGYECSIEYEMELI